MDAEEVRRHLEATGSLNSGHFQLSSGLHSDRYVQCALALSWPARASILGSAIGALWVDDAVDVVVGPALGGVVIAHEVARYLGTPCFFAERKDGVMSLRRGFAVASGARALVVEDVVTTGGSVQEVVRVLGEGGAEVVGVSAIVWRARSDEPSAEDSPFGSLPYRWLLATRAPAWSKEECPLCRAGKPLEQPGSRTVQSQAAGGDAP